MKKTICFLCMFIGMAFLPIVSFAGVASAVTSSTLTPPAEPEVQLSQIKQIQQQGATTSPSAAKKWTKSNQPSSQPINHSMQQPSSSSSPMAQPYTMAAKSQVQLELDLNKNTTYKVFTLANPPRLVVDIQDGSAAAEFDKAALANTPIKKVRTAKHGDNMLRLVFDLDKNLAFTTKEVLNVADANKKQLVITLFDK